MTDMDCRLLEWDTEFFGYPVARLYERRVDAALLAAVDDWCRARQVRCLYYLASAADAASVWAAQQTGMQWCDIRLTLRHPLADLPEPTPAENQVAPPTASERATWEAFAPYLAPLSRFSADPRFGPAAAVALYRRWLARETPVALAARTAEQTVGCLTGEISGTTGIISLLVVAPEYAGQGWATALCRAALRNFTARGCTEARVVTQGHNVAAQRTYQRAGFYTETAEAWFHKWFY